MSVRAFENIIFYIDYVSIILPFTTGNKVNTSFVTQNWHLPVDTLKKCHLMFCRESQLYLRSINSYAHSEHTHLTIQCHELWTSITNTSPAFRHSNPSPSITAAAIGLSVLDARVFWMLQLSYNSKYIINYIFHANLTFNLSLKIIRNYWYYL